LEYDKVFKDVDPKRKALKIAQDKVEKINKELENVLLDLK